MRLVKHFSRFRSLLPVTHTVLAALFGGVGLWQRNRILSHPWLLGGTLWDTTARFHVWPWPFKFAVISNMPAFIVGLLLTVPIRLVRPHMPEAAQLAPSLIFVAFQWYWIGHRLDGWVASAAVSRTVWIFLFSFTAVCAIGAFLPMGHVGYQPYGVLVWSLAAAAIRRMAKTKASVPSAAVS